MASSLGSLLVDIGASTARLEKDLAQAKGQLTSWGRGVSTAMKGVGAAIGAALTVGAVKTMVTDVLDTADAMAKLSQSTGVSVENLSAYRHAAQLADVSIEEVGKSLGKLSRNMSDVQRGTGEAKHAFADLGIKVQTAQGQLKDSDAILMEIADRFSEMPDGAKKTALSMELFGKSGAKLIPLLNAGSDGIAEMKAEAERLGLVLDTDTAKAAEQVNDNFTRLRNGMEGLRTKLVVGTIPTLENLTNMMASARANTEDMDTASASLAAGLKLLATGGVLVGNIFSTSGRIIGGVAAAIVATASGEFRQAGSILSELASDVKTDMTDGIDTIKRVWDDGAVSVSAASKKLSSNATTDLSAITAAAKETEKAYQSLSGTILKAGDTLRAGAIKELEGDTEGATEAFGGMAASLGTASDVVGRLTEGMNLYNHETDRGKTFTSDLGEAGVSTFDAMKTAITGWASGFSQTLTDLVWDADVSFNEILESFGKMLTQMVMQQAVVQPILGAMGFGVKKNALGGTYSGAGISAYSGSVVSKPTIFPFAKGAGLMGEAGDEGIFPLSRGKDGKLGVTAEGMGGVKVEVHNYGSSQARVEQTSQNGKPLIRVIIDAVDDSMRRGQLRNTIAGMGVQPSPIMR